MSAAFTPGPWKVTRRHPDPGTAEGLIEIASLYCADTDTQKANASLIAAAPAMHAALVAQEEADAADRYHSELCERAALEGWGDDPTGSSHLSSAMTRLIAAVDRAKTLRATALAQATATT